MHCLFAFHFSGRVIRDDDSFQSLSGDSLTYVDMTMALDQLLDRTPTDWRAVILRELKALQLGH
jgi:acyl carrier protein